MEQSEQQTEPAIGRRLSDEHRAKVKAERNARGRFVSPTLARIEELVTQGVERRAGLPAARTELLIRQWAELVAAVEAIERHLNGRVLTGKIRPRAPFRTAQQLERRIERIEDILGWHSAKASKPGIPDRVLRRMTPAAREAYENGE